MRYLHDGRSRLLQTCARAWRHLGSSHVDEQPDGNAPDSAFADAMDTPTSAGTIHVEATAQLAKGGRRSAAFVRCAHRLLGAATGAAIATSAGLSAVAIVDA